MLVLFFDTYIVSGVGSKSGLYASNYVERELSGVRDQFKAYRWQKKIDVVKYTLLSYSTIEWDKVVIRFECEDTHQTNDFLRFCKKYFPESIIENTRSDTAEKYTAALKKLQLPPKSWVFFSPNNDHPYISDPDCIKKYIDYAEGIQSQFPENDIGIIYSHKFEGSLDNKISQPLWGYFNNKFKKLMLEDETAFVTLSNVLPLDSVQILRYEYLLNLFSSSQNKGRVIRLEDLEFNWAKNTNFMQISPKVELCRHYDGYTSYMQFVPPLFIPDDFFDKKIKLRYGYVKRKKGYVNINPNARNINKSIDLPVFLSDIPYFWRGRISVIDINPNFKEKYDEKTSPFYRNMNNPWQKRHVLINISRSFYIFYVGYSRFKIATFIRIILRKTPFYPLLKKIRRAVVNEKYT